MGEKICQGFRYMAQGFATLHIKQYVESRVSAINDSRESIQNREYLLKFEAKFENPSDYEKGTGEEFICEKNGQKNLV